MVDVLLGDFFAGGEQRGQRTGGAFHRVVYFWNPFTTLLDVCFQRRSRGSLFDAGSRMLKFMATELAEDDRGAFDLVICFFIVWPIKRQYLAWLRGIAIVLYVRVSALAHN
jgi:hypothetical protein